MSFNFPFYVKSQVRSIISCSAVVDDLLFPLSARMSARHPPGTIGFTFRHIECMILKGKTFFSLFHHGNLSSNGRHKAFFTEKFIY